MKKYIVLVLPFVLAASLGVCAAHGEFFRPRQQNVENSSLTSDSDKTVIATGSDSRYNGEVFPAVIVDGEMYRSTGNESEIKARCGVMDGRITSSVEADSLPSENNQSNFGSGYGYQYGFDSDTIEVFIDGKWIVFKLCERAICGYPEDVDTQDSSLSSSSE